MVHDRRDEQMIKYALLTVLLLAISVLQGCSLGRQLQTQTADPRSIEGTYDLFLYGCRYPDDIENAAFLISGESKYPVDLFVPETSYKVKKGMLAKEAFIQADAFVRCGIHTVTETRLHRIPDDSGGTIGYEVLPRYLPYDVGGSDPLLVSYSLMDNTVTVYIRLFPEVERRLNSMDIPGPGGN
jgi:hypothetical protein